MESTTAAGAAPTGVCDRCQGPLPVPGKAGGRPARFCSTRCRKAAHNAAHRAPADPAAAAVDRRAQVRAALDEMMTLSFLVLPGDLRGMVDLLDESELARVLKDVKAGAAIYQRLLDRLNLPEVPAPRPAAASVRIPSLAEVKAATAARAVPVPVEADPLPGSVAALQHYLEGRNSASAPAGPATVTRAKPARSSARRSTAGAGAALRRTAEQEAILAACAAGTRTTLVEAGAGTGKTTTLVMAAGVMPARDGLYLAFGRSIAQDARRRFPPGTLCQTSHAVAHRALNYRYAPRLDLPRQNAEQAAELLGVDAVLELGDLVLGPAMLARHALGAVKRYCHSAAEQIGPEHVPAMTAIDRPDHKQMLAEAVLPIARAAWADINSTGGRLKFDHDYYVKIWALGEPALPFSWVMLDEAQDTNPALAKVLKAQDAQMVVVGDSQQSIYGWRGAVNALGSWPAQASLMLSKSWRFGPRIAAEANVWLSELGARMRLTGNPERDSRISYLGADLADAILCRTNGEAMRQAMQALASGRRPALAGGTDEIKKMAKAAIELQKGKPTSHPELGMFRTWAQVRDYADHDAAGQDLRVWVRLIDDYGAETLLKVAGDLVDEDSADVVVSTLHKAKGREWGKVLIADDFREPKNQNGTPAPVDPELGRVSYVAVTRARDVLDNSGLAWIHNRGLAMDDGTGPIKMDDLGDGWRLRHG